MLSPRDVLLLILRIPFTALFVALLLWYIQYEFKRKVSFAKYRDWLIAAFAAQIAGSIAFAASNGKAGDFVLHTIGGGLMCMLIFVYLEKTYGLKLSWRVEIILLFGFVSALGVLNELAEYAYELLKLGVMSPDTHDTWRDLTANSFGALIAWTAYRSILLVKHRGQA